MPAFTRSLMSVATLTVREGRDKQGAAETTEEDAHRVTEMPKSCALSLSQLSRARMLGVVPGQPAVEASLCAQRSCRLEEQQHEGLSVC